MPKLSLEKYGVQAATRGRQRNPVARVSVYNPKGDIHSYFDLAPGQKGWFKRGKGSSGLFLPGRLPKSGETWLLVEGVKDAAALDGLGYNAAGLPRAEMPATYAELFRGAYIVIIHDLDRAGTEGATKTAARLAGVAATVRVARLPGEIKDKGGDDVRDILASQGEQAVRDAIEAAGQQDSTPSDMPEIIEEHERTEIANARRLVERHHDELRYIRRWDKWMSWDGRRWEVGPLGAESRAKETAQELWEQAEQADIYLDDDDNNRPAIKAFAKSSCSAKGIAAALTLARSDSVIDHDELNRYPLLLNVENGVIDLETGDLSPHRPELLLTQIAPVAFDPKSLAPRWQQFLEEVTDGDTELQEYLQRLAGYYLIGLVDTHTLQIFYGTGCNGKSVLLNTLLELLGSDYATKTSHDFLLHKNGGHPTEKADMYGRRLAVCIEADEDRRLAESEIKELTGGDRQKARRMREDFWEFDPTAKICLAANHKPEVRGDDNGVWRRLKLVPFTVTIPKEKVDRQLSVKLREEMPGILAWAVRGTRLYLDSGLDEPTCVLTATNEYRSESDTIMQFLSERTVNDANGKIKAGHLHESYREWAIESGVNPLSKIKFGKRLDAKNILKSCRSDGTYRIGIRLKGQPSESDCLAS